MDFSCRIKMLNSTSRYDLLLLSLIPKFTLNSLFSFKIEVVWKHGLTFSKARSSLIKNE